MAWRISPRWHLPLSIDWQAFESQRDGLAESAKQQDGARADGGICVKKMLNENAENRRMAAQ